MQYDVIMCIMWKVIYPVVASLCHDHTLPALAAARLQRWAITMSAYNYDIEFHPTAKHANGDSLSRLPLNTTSTTEMDGSACLFNIQQIGTLPVDSKQLHLETSDDPLLSKVLRYTKKGGHKRWIHSC